MNTKLKHPTKVRGKNCDHVFLEIDGQQIRSIKPLKADKDHVTGKDKTGACPFPRCER